MFSKLLLRTNTSLRNSFFKAEVCVKTIKDDIFRLKASFSSGALKLCQHHGLHFPENKPHY